MTNLIDLAGRKFNEWTVVRHVGGGRWLARCSCGREHVRYGSTLRNGQSKRCKVCTMKSGVRRSHDMSKTRLYSIWRGMKARCCNASDPAFARYGGRGIRICDQWREDFANFAKWALANGYKSTLTIERIDNDGGYSPVNCRWATYAEQSRNTRRNRYIEYAGRKWLVADLAKKVGIQPATLKQRLFRYGWSIEKAISAPVKLRTYGPTKPWEALGMSRSTWHRRGKPMQCAQPDDQQ